MSDKEEYAVVTVLTQYRLRYVIPVSKLQQCNPDAEVDPVEWANDSVTCEDVSEFSQLHLGEVIVDNAVMSEEEILALMTKDNEYLADWSDEKKLEWINNCWETIK